MIAGPLAKPAERSQSGSHSIAAETLRRREKQKLDQEQGAVFAEYEKI
jgi:predicted ABC-type ATPase